MACHGDFAKEACNGEEEQRNSDARVEGTPAYMPLEALSSAAASFYEVGFLLKFMMSEHGIEKKRRGHLVLSSERLSRITLTVLHVQCMPVANHE